MSAGKVARLVEAANDVLWDAEHGSGCGAYESLPCDCFKRRLVDALGEITKGDLLLADAALEPTEQCAPPIYFKAACDCRSEGKA